ncbi:MAG: YeeE/YedE family protein [Sphingobacteriales bacterium]|nr:YeeE/YedE family protein [Sphingobacteriales bacterium]
MGPLIPNGIVSGDWNLVFAFIFGLAFGFILEQAGFSSSRKLAGVFYGYDFVVLRVFFTAAVTAMIGLTFFHYFGWVDLNQLYVVPTYLYSAIVGGLIMGLGFILGGFCPGTSFCGIAIGKIDAMFFAGGMGIGIFIFGWLFPLFEGLYNSKNLGSVLVYQSLGVPRWIFVFGFAALALIAFVITDKIEKNVKKVDY